MVRGNRKSLLPLRPELDHRFPSFYHLQYNARLACMHSGESCQKKLVFNLEKHQLSVDKKPKQICVDGLLSISISLSLLTIHSQSLFSNLVSLTLCCFGIFCLIFCSTSCLSLLLFTFSIPPQCRAGSFGLLLLTKKVLAPLS